MISKRMCVVAMLAGVLLAGALHADSVNYVVGKGDTAKVVFEDKATITSWNAAGIKFKAGDGKEVSVAYADIISVDRRGGTMSRELDDILDFAGQDPLGAAQELLAIVTAGSDLDKQEAAIVRAQILDSESGNESALVAEAVKAYNSYITSWKAGYFAREAYRGLAALQERDNKLTGARETLGKMIAADASLVREGNQLLGEFEASLSKPNWAAAIDAFKKAQSAAGTDTNYKYLAMAWEGAATLKNGNAAGAKTLLEQVLNDENFNDDNTGVDEIALAVAYPAYGDLNFDAGAYQKAYDAYIKGAYYAWWTGGVLEGHCLGYGYLCAKKLEGTDAKWTTRKEKLKTALAVGFPRVLAEVDKE